MKKFIKITAATILLLFISLLIFNQLVMRSIKTEIIINASTEKVWDILMDHENYPNWNPFIKQISGVTEKGNSLSVTMQIENKNPMNFKPEVLTNKKLQEFRWKGKLFVSGLFDGEHYFLLEQLSQNQTKFIQGENFSGLLSGLLFKMIGKDTETGFNAMNEAIRLQIETN